MEPKNKPIPQRIVEIIIFNTKWLLVPFYFYLIWTLVKLGYHLFADGTLSNENLMNTLEDVDIVMIANLVKMIITGSYNSFVDKSHGAEGEQISSGALKVKMSTSIMGVSAIHLLQTFINAENLDLMTIVKQLLIHAIFIVGAYYLARIDFLHEKSEKQHHK